MASLGVRGRSTPPDVEVIDRCRGCGGQDLLPIVALGEMPLADGLLDSLADVSQERRFSLTLVFCPRCALVQIKETVRPDILYGDRYPYFSSFSDALVDHARRNVAGLIERYGVGGDSLVVELASNDGYLLQWIQQAGVPVLGVDPSPGPVAVARDRGIETLCEFFDLELAEELVSQGRSADLVIGNNVLAHVPDQNRFVEAISRLLAPGGSVVMEFPYVKDLVDNSEFDTIYHEHHCYFSVTSVAALFARHGLTTMRVEHLDVHGGSLRVHFSAEGEPEASVAEYLEMEEAAGLTGIAYYGSLAERAESVSRELVALLDSLIESGGRVAAYGAAAKGTTLLNFAGIGSERLEYVVDRNVHKHGRYMPGVHLPVVGTEWLEEDPPDYLLLLAWNFSQEIIAQQASFAQRGGRFVVPIPEPEVVEAS